jgi:hypothetical protein
VAEIVEGEDTDIVAEDFGNAPIPVAAATTEVTMSLTDIVAGKHAINVEQPSPDDPEDSVACGNIGGVVDEHGDLFVGLSESNESGHFGVAWLHDNGTSTTIVVFLAHPDEEGASQRHWRPSPRQRRRLPRPRRRLQELRRSPARRPTPHQ